jgi:thiol:disulfide interchange protein
MLKKTIKKLLLAVMVLFCTGQFLAAQNINFSSGDWKEVLAKAGKEHKLVFVDVYAVWCGPCKMMARKVFTQRRVADHFNASFINYMADAEKGDGVSIAQKYQVNSVPTYLYINSEGKLVHKIEGSMTADEFIAESKKALQNY